MHSEAPKELASNDDLLDFLRFVRRVGPATKYGDLTAEERAAFKAYRTTIDAFLLRMAFRECGDREEASRIGDAARREFLQKAFAVVEDSVFARRLPRGLWGGASPRYWLFLRVKDLAREAMSRQRVVEDPIPGGDLARSCSIPPQIRLDSLREELIHDHCTLRRSSRRKRMADAGFCRKECEVLFMKDMGFSQIEIARGLKVSAPRVTAYVESCRNAEFELGMPRPMFPKVSQPGGSAALEEGLRIRWEATRQVELARAEAVLLAYVRSQLTEAELEKGWNEIQEIALEQQKANRKKGPVTRMIESMREWWQSLGW